MNLNNLIETKIFGALEYTFILRRTVRLSAFICSGDFVQLFAALEEFFRQFLDKCGERVKESAICKCLRRVTDSPAKLTQTSVGHPQPKRKERNAKREAK